MARLDEICILKMGQSPESSSYNENGNGIPFFQGNADFGELHPKVRVWCDNPTKIANIGDILISVRAPIGALNIADKKCCIGRGLAALTANKEVCEMKYLWYALSSKIEELNSKGTGSTFKAISKSVLAETQIPIPTLVKQNHIATVLDKVTDLIAKQERQIELLDNIVKARFVEMFGDVIQNNKNWISSSLSNIATSRLGKMLDSSKNTGKNSFPYLANFNVQWFRFDVEKLNQMDFNEAEQAEFELLDGDLLVCEGGEIGRCAIWHNQVKNCYFQKAIHRVRCNPQKILPEYLAHWFKYNCDHNGFAAIEGAKATISHLPSVKLKALIVAVPPLKLQQQFAAFIEQTDKSKSQMQKSLEQLETLKKALMQKYFG